MLWSSVRFRISCGKASSIRRLPVFGLMASHMAEGRAWPVFFYGQAYMGSLEPMLGALFCLLFGTSAFAVALGTGLSAFLLTLVAWRMARALAGPWAALYAAALFATVSPAFAAYMADPRGGYAMALLQQPYRHISKRTMPAEWHDPLPHTHVALDDAKAQGALLCNLLQVRR